MKVLTIYKPLRGGGFPIGMMYASDTYMDVFTRQLLKLSDIEGLKTDNGEEYNTMLLEQFTTLHTVTDSDIDNGILESAESDAHPNVFTIGDSFFNGDIVDLLATVDEAYARAKR